MGKKYRLQLRGRRWCKNHGASLMFIHALQFFPNHSVDLICSFKKHLSLFFLQHHWLYGLVIPHCHYVFRLFFFVAPFSYNNSWTEPEFSDCHTSSGYFRSLHVNSSDWSVDSESRYNFMGKDATTKPAFLLSADLAGATLPNPLFVFQ